MPFRAQRQSIKGVSIPAAIGGMDLTQNMSTMSPENCVYTFNLMPKDLGMTVREGNKEWANGYTGTDGGRTIMPFYGLAPAGAGDRLFVATEIGIFDVTTQGDTAPVQVVTWPIQTGFAGICEIVQFTNTGGGAFLLVADAENGYYTYEEDTATWTEVPDGVGGITAGPSARDLAFVTIWKNRIWFVEKHTGTAWYSNVGVFLGDLASFEFGNKMRYGGQLVGVWNWTLDGGDGVDDYLVAVGAGGDVIVYQGTDPSAASTFRLVGSWFVGAVPAGRRIASDFGGDLLVLSVYGIISMNALLSGSGMEGGGQATRQQYMTAKIAPILALTMEAVRTEIGWELTAYPREGLVIIDTPPRPSQPSVQFVYHIATAAWGLWRDLSIQTMAAWQGSLYFSKDNDTRIWEFTGGLDDVFLDPDVDGPPEPINWSMLTAYSSLGSINNKLIQFLRPVFRSDSEPLFEIQALFDFNTQEILTAPSGNIGDFSGLWDSGQWDLAVWGGARIGNALPKGTTGIGRYVAVALRGSSATPTSLLAIDLQFSEGGYL